MQTAKLLEKGWKVLRIWEHEIEQAPSKVVDAVIGALEESAQSFEPRNVVVRVEAASLDGETERWYISEMLDRSEILEELRPRNKRVATSSD